MKAVDGRAGRCCRCRRRWVGAPPSSPAIMAERMAAPSVAPVIAPVLLMASAVEILRRKMEMARLMPSAGRWAILPSLPPMDGGVAVAAGDDGGIDGRAVGGGSYRSWELPSVVLSLPMGGRTKIRRGE